ncbi:MAG: hypothetical protein K0U52_12635, partial [Gammaproteobacteria bacterium]|nr:hypothetical protein [Gammaproteobacteria bacterium]
MKKTKIVVIKVPLDPSLKIDRPPIFPRMSKMYLELLENKQKVKKSMRNKNYEPDPDDLTPPTSATRRDTSPRPSPTLEDGKHRRASSPFSPSTRKTIRDREKHTKFVLAEKRRLEADLLRKKREDELARERESMKKLPPDPGLRMRASPLFRGGRKRPLKIEPVIAPPPPRAKPPVRTRFTASPRVVRSSPPPPTANVAPSPSPTLHASVAPLRRTEPIASPGMVASRPERPSPFGARFAASPVPRKKVVAVPKTSVASPMGAPSRPSSSDGVTRTIASAKIDLDLTNMVRRVEQGHAADDEDLNVEV